MVAIACLTRRETYCSNRASPGVDKCDASAALGMVHASSSAASSSGSLREGRPDGRRATTGRRPVYNYEVRDIGADHLSCLARVSHSSQFGRLAFGCDSWHAELQFTCEELARDSAQLIRELPAVARSAFEFWRAQAKLVD